MQALNGHVCNTNTKAQGNSKLLTQKGILGELLNDPL
jgi:hypothetical protein